MNPWLHPVGPLPDRVYWFRRALLLGGLVVFTVLVSGTVRALLPAGGTPDTIAAPSPSSTQQSRERGISVAEEETCDPGDVRVVSAVGAQNVPINGPVQLSLVITNNGDESCVIDAGTAALELQVTRGPKLIWSSDHCQQASASALTTMQPGDSLSSNLTWRVEGSAPGCEGNAPEITAGEHAVVARVGTMVSEPTYFELTDGSEEDEPEAGEQGE